MDSLEAANRIVGATQAGVFAWYLMTTRNMPTAKALEIFAPWLAGLDMAIALINYTQHEQVPAGMAAACTVFWLSWWWWNRPPRPPRRKAAPAKATSDA